MRPKVKLPFKKGNFICLLTYGAYFQLRCFCLFPFLLLFFFFFVLLVQNFSLKLEEFVDWIGKMYSKAPLISAVPLLKSYDFPQTLGFQFGMRWGQSTWFGCLNFIWILSLMKSLLPFSAFVICMFGTHIPSMFSSNYSIILSWLNWGDKIIVFFWLYNSAEVDLQLSSY